MMAFESTKEVAMSLLYVALCLLHAVLFIPRVTVQGLLYVIRWVATRLKTTKKTKTIKPRRIRAAVWM
ncbi:hypothetical protein MMA231_04124 (plasmid) [Asticcacaulis sp. MM231]